MRIHKDNAAAIQPLLIDYSSFRPPTRLTMSIELLKTNYGTGCALMQNDSIRYALDATNGALLITVYDGQARVTDHRIRFLQIVSSSLC